MVQNRARDWFRQAVRDLEQAEDSRRAGRHEWACFAAQQAAKKAVKALHLRWGQEAWGYVVAKLLRELPEAARVPDELVEKGRGPGHLLHPTALPQQPLGGAPFEHYGPLQSEEAIRYP